MLERLRAHWAPCYKIAVYRPGETKKGHWVWKLRQMSRDSSEVFTWTQVQQRHPGIQSGGKHNNRIQGNVPRNETIMRAVEVCRGLVIFAYVPFRTKKGHWVWRRGREVAGPYRSVGDFHASVYANLKAGNLHNVRLTDDEVIQALAQMDEQGTPLVELL